MVGVDMEHNGAKQLIHHVGCQSREQEGRVYLLSSKISCGVSVKRTGGSSLPAEQ